MGRLIDADALIRLFEKYLDPTETAWNRLVRKIIRIIDLFPTADSAEAVRCKYCKKRNTDACRMIHGHGMNRHVFDDDFCSYGERKETDHDI